jgi:hypothetical protein
MKTLVYALAALITGLLVFVFGQDLLRSIPWQLVTLLILVISAYKTAKVNRRIFTNSSDPGSETTLSPRE